MDKDLESLYLEAKTALRAGNYDRASDLLKQILLIDENYKDASRLLAQSVRLKRRRWYNDPRLWGAVGFAMIVALGFFIAPRIKGFYAVQPSAPVIIDSPAATLPPTAFTTATETLLPTPTPVPLTWKRVSIGQEFERDTVTAIVIDPKDPEVLYASMKNAGVYKSIDGGSSWHPEHRGLVNTQVSSLLIDPQSPNILYAGTMGGIFKTEDGGKIWSKIGEGISLVMDPQNEAHLYARDNDSSIYESTNQGKNWKTVYSSEGNCPGAILSLVIHPEDGNTLFVGGGGGECEAGIYLSNDGGRSWGTLWSAPFQETKHIQYLDRFSIGVDEQENYYLAATWGHLRSRSTDTGIKWNTVLDFGPLATFDSTEAVYFYCDPHLCKYNLGGKQKATLGKPEVGTVTSITLSPVDPNTVYVGGEGISVSKDGGMTWTKLNNGLGNGKLQLDSGTGEVPILYIQPGECDEFYNLNQVASGGWDTKQSLYISTNGGGTWNFANQLGCHLIKDADGSTLYRIGKSAWYSGGAWRGLIWQSLDSGKSWERVLTPVGVRTLAVDPFQSERLQIYTSWGGREEHDIEFISEDSGHTWKRSDPLASTKPCYGSTLQFIDKYRPMAIDPFDGNHVFVIDDGALLESHDSCDTTSDFATAPNTSMNSIAFDNNKPGTLYAGTDEGAYISFDSGKTWNQINGGLLGATVVYSIVVDKDSGVYAATPYGIFKLENK